METWNLKQINDRKFRDVLTKDPSSITGLVDLQLSDGTIRVSKRMAYLNLFWFPILAKFRIPLRIDHFIKSTPLNRENITERWDDYYDEIMSKNRNNADALKDVLWQVISDLYRFCSEDIVEYVATMDIIDLAEIMQDPHMIEITDTKKNINETMGSREVEKYIDVQNERIIKLLKDPDKLANKTMLPYATTGQINKFQVYQTLYAFGIRTDVSDNIVTLPVLGNALSGLNNIQEFAAESLSAKKASFYNKVAVSDSQYFGRKQHLIASSIEHVYNRDCGSKQLVSFNLTSSNYKNAVGMNIVVDGKLINLTRHNIKDYIDTTIHMRFPMTCKYRKGVCKVCGGSILNNIPTGTNIGITSAIYFVSKVTQNILSSKHLVKTSSMVHELPKQAATIMFTNMNEIRWKTDIATKIHKYQLGIPAKMFSGLHDVILLRNDRQIKEERFSSVKTMFIRDPKGRVIEYELENNKQIPYLSAEMLQHVRDNYHSLDADDRIVWIPLEGTAKLPIFRTVVVNDNMLQFVSSVNNFLSSSIKTYESCQDVLADFTKLVYTKNDVNLLHIGVLLKSYMITSGSDYRVPRVEDANNVRFQTISTVLNNRHIGTKLLYERLNKFITHPNTYIVKRQESQFDYLTIK